MPIVYLATNTVNGKRYVGMTKWTLKTRRGQHYTEARGLRGGCRIFYAAIRKYGTISFHWKIISEHLTPEDAIEAERAAIAELKPEYNISKGARGPSGVPWTPERYILMAERRKLRKPPSADQIARWRKAMEEHGWNGRPVICLDDGRVFRSSADAQRHYGVSSLSAVFSGESYVTGGKHFARYNHPISDDDRLEAIAEIERKRQSRGAKISAAKRGKRWTAASKKKLSEALTGIKRGPRVTPVSQATRNKMRQSAINRTDGKWQEFRRLGPLSSARRVICIDDGNVYASATEAARAYGVARSALIELCLGQKGRKSVGGRRFQYVTEAKDAA